MIANEDQLRSLYDRVMAHTSEDDWAETIERINEERRQELEERISDEMERIFGVR